MDFAFGIVSMLPKGGLQLHCLDIAHILQRRGHRVTIFTTVPFTLPSMMLDIVVLPVTSFSNHGRDLAFAKSFKNAVQNRFTRVIGFNKLFDIDLLYCGDPSVHDKRRNWLVRGTRRHQTQLLLERACFHPDSATRILALSQESAASYRRYWNTPAARFTVLPPAIDPRRQRPHLRTPENRRTIRQALHLPLEGPLWLWVGTKPQTKGLDRVIDAMQRIAEPHLAILGVAEDSVEGRRIWPQIQRAHVKDRVHFLGYRDDVPEMMAAADLLVHPARLDVTGQVLLEAVSNGLPAIASEQCGFARYVRDAEAGLVLGTPYQQTDLEAALRHAMNPARLCAYSENGVHYGTHRLSMVGLEVAADCIEGRTSPTARQLDPLPDPVAPQTIHL